MVFKDLGGWKTLEMAQRYAHLALSHLAARHAKTATFWSKDTEEKTLGMIVSA